MEITDFEILCKIPTGSNILCSNCKDEDYLVVVKDCGEKGYVQLGENGIDYFVRDIPTFTRIATADTTLPQGLYSICVPLAIKNGLDGTLPIENYNWFDYKENIINTCLNHIGGRYFGSIRQYNGKNRNACLKLTYWVLASYFALVNNSFDFTAEQLDIIQKCHDNELPRSYAEDVYGKLLEMLPKQEQAEPKTEVAQTLSYDELVDSKIRARYTVSQEFAILRQRDTKPDEFAEYNAYCEQCKAEAKAELGIG